MQNTATSKYTVSFGLSLALASVANALLVVAKEKIPAVAAGMKRVTGHHWATHALVILGSFGLFGWLLARTNAGQGVKMTVNRLISLLMAGVMTGIMIIFGFYLLGD